MHFGRVEEKVPTLTNALSLHAMCSAMDPRFRDLSFLSAESARALQKNFTQLLTVEAANADDNAGEPSAKEPLHVSTFRLVKAPQENRQHAKVSICSN